MDLLSNTPHRVILPIGEDVAAQNAFIIEKKANAQLLVDSITITDLEAGSFAADMSKQKMR